MCALWSKNDDDEKRKRQIILDLLEDIRDQRAKLKLEFDEGVTSIKDLTGTLLEYDGDGLTVDICSAVHPMAGASPFFREFDLAAHRVGDVDHFSVSTVGAPANTNVQSTE